MGPAMADKEFLKRWSEAKLTDKEATPEQPVAEVEQPSPPPDLPDVDGLDGESDYTPFLAEGVPEELANRALRKLWRSDPAISALDGLNDYDDDYTSLGIVETVVETAYKIGKGLLAETEAEEEIPEEETESEEEDATPEN